MRTKSIKTKSIITSAIILITMAAIIALFGFANNAVADEAKDTNNEPFIFSGVQIVGLNGETPSQGTDFSIAEKWGGGKSLMLNTPNWVLTGTAEAGSEKDDINIQSDKVYLRDLTIDNNGLGITLVNPTTESCEVTLLKCTKKEYSTVSSMVSGNKSITINGEGMLYFSGGGLTVYNSLTIVGVTLGLYAMQQYSNAQSTYAVSVMGDLTMKSAKLIAENHALGGTAYGAHLAGKVLIDEASEVFLAGNTVSMDYNDETALADALGSEELIFWNGDKTKINKTTANRPMTGGLSFVKCIADTGDMAKTIYKAAVTPPTPEPVNPEYTTAQTGDNNLWIVLSLLIVAGAGLAVFLIVRRRNKAKQHKPIHKNK